MKRLEQKALQLQDELLFYEGRLFSQIRVCIKILFTNFSLGSKINNVNLIANVIWTPARSKTFYIPFTYLLHLSMHSCYSCSFFLPWFNLNNFIAKLLAVYENDFGIFIALLLLLGNYLNYLKYLKHFRYLVK